MVQEMGAKVQRVCVGEVGSVMFAHCRRQGPGALRSGQTDSIVLELRDEKNLIGLISWRAWSVCSRAVSSAPINGAAHPSLRKL